MGNSDSRHSNTASTNAPNTVNSNNLLTVSQAPPQQAPSNGAPAPPGAYKMPGAPKTQRFWVTIPRGVKPGQHFAVLVNGQQMMVKCPEGNGPGDRLVVTAPRSVAQQYVVSVPVNVKPGQQFRVMINNQEVMVTCPPNVKPGQRVTFQLPNPAERPAQAAPNHQMFEVTVPEGVRQGTIFE
jgi:hypothetical protein